MLTINPVIGWDRTLRIFNAAQPNVLDWLKGEYMVIKGPRSLALWWCVV